MGNSEGEGGMSEASLTCAHFVGLLSRRQPDTTRHAVGRSVNRCSIFCSFFFFHHRVSLGQVRIEIIVGNNRRKERRHAHVSRLRRQLRDNLRRTTSSRSLTGETCERTNAQRSTKRTRSGDLCASRSATCSARQSVRDTRTVYVHGVIECLR